MNNSLVNDKMREAFENSSIFTQYYSDEHEFSGDMYQNSFLQSDYIKFCEGYLASQAQQTESKWIRVEERLPELSDKELIVRLKPRRKNQKKVEYRIAIYDKPCEWEDPVFWCVVREVDIEVDSWMPLPPAPEGE